LEKLKAFCCWSGGKESVLSLFYAQKKGLSVSHLVNMANSTGRISRSHGIQSSILAEQSKTIGIELIQRGASWNTYEQEFKKVIRGLKKQGVVCGVFGDIDLQEHRDWVERVCRETGIKAILPLWQRKREELIKEFIDAGFKAVVCATNADYLGKEWLSRKVDKKFIEDLKDKGGVDLCGEKGEYHSFVFDGPVFKKAVRFTVGRKIFKKQHWFLELITK